MKPTIIIMALASVMLVITWINVERQERAHICRKSHGVLVRGAYGYVCVDERVVIGD